MKILVLNCGSSSFKYQLIDMDGEVVLAKGLVERIGIDGSKIKHTKTGKDPVSRVVDFPNHTVAIKYVLDILLRNVVCINEDGNPPLLCIVVDSCHIIPFCQW